MNLYQINEAIYALVDEETGEILNYEAFEALAMERDQKLENVALWYKNLTAEATAIREEEKNLAARRKACENKAERLKNYLSAALAGTNFKTARVACSFRASTKLEIRDEATFIKTMEEAKHFEFLKYKAPEVNKTAITEAIKAGQVVEGAELVKNSNISIK